MDGSALVASRFSIVSPGPQKCKNMRPGGSFAVCLDEHGCQRDGGKGGGQALKKEKKRIDKIVKHLIAVGTVIAHRPPRRPGRAQLRHPVLTSSI
jgi:hypothetical protein